MTVGHSQPDLLHPTPAKQMKKSSIPASFTLLSSVVLATVATFLATPSQSFALNQTWENTGTDFATGGNWVSGTAPVNNATADFALFGNTGASAVNPVLAASRSIGGFNFLASSYSYSVTGAGNFTIGGGTSAILHNGANVQTFANAGLTLSGAQTWTVNTGGELRVNTGVSGAVTLSTVGAGTVTLGANNTFTQLAVENNSVVNLNHAGAPGTGEIRTAFNSALDNTSGAAITLSNNNNWRINSTTSIFKGTNDLSLGGGVIRSNSSNRNLRVDAGTLTAAGLSSFTPANNEGITIAGAGTLVIAGNASDMTGTVNVSGGPSSLTGGNLVLNNTTGSGSGTGAVMVNNTGTLAGQGIIDTGTTNNGVTVAAGGKLFPTAAAQSLRMDLGTGSLNISGAVTAANTQSLVFTLGTVSSMISLTDAASTLNIGTSLLEFDDFAFTPGSGFAPGIYTLFDTSNAITGILGSNLSGMIGGFNASISMVGSQDLILTVVPEPGTWALLAVGFITLIVMNRRRKAYNQG